MADGQHLSGEAVDVEVKDRGLFGLIGKKEQEGEKCQEVEKREEEVLAAEFEKVQVTQEEECKAEKKEEEKKEGLLEKLHRSHSSSSSSSSEEEDTAEGEKTGEKKKKKKKGLKEKIQEKISGEKKEKQEEEKKAEVEVAAAVVEDNTIPVEKTDELPSPDYSEAPEKKSLLEKIKEKLPGGGQQKKPTEEAPAAAECADQVKEHEADSPGAKEKKGFLGKIMDKIPGYHKGNGAEETPAAPSN